MKRTILKNVGIGLCFLLSTGTVCAQNYPGKVKNAQGIEVTYQSNYKGCLLYTSPSPRDA